MGNKIARRREMVDDKYTRPQGLYQLKDIDHKKLRKLILDSKLAPCYPGLDDCALDLDECPICFLNYPRLNHSRCCRKMICTECFLQIRPSRSSKPTKCPFCKTANYVVEYRGVRTKEEKRVEQIEEQKVIEAQIRMRRQELRDEEERIQKTKHMSFSNRTISPAVVEVPYWSNISQADELISSQGSCGESASRWHSSSRQSREYTFDLDMDTDIDMVLFFDVPLWDRQIQKNASSSGRNFPQRSSSQDCYSLPVVPPVVASPSSGLACSVAALAEHQHMNEDSVIISRSTAPVYNMVCSSGSSPARMHSEVGNYPPGSWTEALSNGKASPREYYEWSTDHEARGGLSYTSSNVTVDTQSVVDASHLLPDSFEEQMMLAMAISLAEFQARMRSSQGVTWLQ